MGSWRTGLHDAGRDVHGGASDDVASSLRLRRLPRDEDGGPVAAWLAMVGVACGVTRLGVVTREEG